MGKRIDWASLAAERSLPPASDWPEGTTWFPELDLFVTPDGYRHHFGRNSVLPPTEQENQMTTKSRKLLDAELALAEKQAEAALNRLERARAAVEKAPSYPKEPDGAITVLRFAIRFDKFKDTYDFAAIRVKDRWYTTGSSCPTMGWSWEELIDWMREADHCYPLHVINVAHSFPQIEVTK